MTDSSTSEEIEEQADGYERFEIDLPGVSYPFNALKSHNVQFGLCVGILLGMLSRSSATLECDLYVVAGTLGAGTASLLMALSIVFYAVGLRPDGPVEPAEADESAVGVVQIRRKPHYMVTPMTVVYVGTAVVSCPF